MNKFRRRLVLAFFWPPLLLSAQLYTVNTTLDQDDGVCDDRHCSLREAMNAANADNRPSLIQFALPGSPPFVIQPTAPFPVLAEAETTIDGATLDNFLPGQVVLDGSLLTGEEANGLVISGDDTHIYGLFIRGFPAHGIQVVGARGVQIGSREGNRRNIIGSNRGSGILVMGTDRRLTLQIGIENNYIGLAENGETILANSLDGIEIRDVGGLQIGGETTNAGNVIGGNKLMGIRATRAAGLLIIGNKVGTNAVGGRAAPNGINGVNLTDCPTAQIGRLGAANLISGNREDGVLIARNDIGLPITDIRIQSNLIGTDISGTRPLGNAGSGIQAFQLAGGLLIGGAEPGQGNVLGANNRGIWLNNCSGLPVAGNSIGVDARGTIDLGNRIAGIDLLNARDVLIGGDGDSANTIAFNREGVRVGPNSRSCRISQSRFFCNQLAGINVTEGSNGDVGAPAFLCAYSDEITGIAPPLARVEVFKNDELCADLACQGRTFLGAAMADENGRWQLSGNYPIGGVYTATATDLNDNTSIFLECVPARIRPQATADNTGPYCYGSSIQLQGRSNLAGATFSWSGPVGFSSRQQNPSNAKAAGAYVLTIEQGGCPSRPDTTLVEFVENIPVEIGDDPAEWLCPGEVFRINETVYDAQRPTGMEVVPGRNGACDTIYTIDLRFLAPAVHLLDTIICDGERLLIEGEIFDKDNLSGSVVLPGAAQNGCDSLVMVELSFYEPAISHIDTTLCRGSSFIFNGEAYDERRPTGTVVIPGGSAAGCDSLINIQVHFFPAARLDIDTLLCRGEQITINGQAYDWDRPFGTEILRGAAAHGCDSLINVRLRFYEPAVSRLDTILCRGGSFIFNGRRYDANRTYGEEIFSGVGAHGCDSAVIVNLRFVDPPEISLDTTLCRGQFLLINSRRYDETKPTGVEILPGRGGLCDTTLSVKLNFVTEIVHELKQTLCAGESLLVNGRLYDEDNPRGMERIPGGSVTGCDSVIVVTLQFLPSPRFRLEETLCPGEFLELNGARYDASNPSGVVVLAGLAANGCDSLVEVELTFVDLEAQIRSEKTACTAGATGALVIDRIAGGTAPYIYGLLGGEERPVTSLPLRIDKLLPGLYDVYIDDANGCSIRLVGLVEAPANLEVYAGPDQLLRLGDSIRLDPQISQAPQRIQWSPADGLSCADCLDPTARPERTTVYTITVNNAEGCTASDAIRIEVFEPSGFFVPNAFSPNGDGKNEVFAVFADPSRIDQVMRFQLYDRWGNQVFERRHFFPNDESLGWDGRLPGGQTAPAGVYIYLLELLRRDGKTLEVSGAVNLLR